MKIVMLSFICTLWACWSLAQKPQELLPAEEHLVAVNRLWSQYSAHIPKETVAFEDENARIEYHLVQVINLLRKADEGSFSFNQLVERTLLLDELEHYAHAKVFPINRYHAERRPYFVDHLGTHCAVGYLMQQSGNETLVQQIVKEHNYDYVKDIRTEGVGAWAQAYGFRADELALIQPGYPPSSTMNPVQDGANGRLVKIEANPWLNGLLIAGEFTELNQMPCVNIGLYANNQFSCLGNGIDGTIRDFYYNQSEIYVCGSFPINGQIYPLAKYDGSTWSYLQIPGRVNAEGTAMDEGWSTVTLEVAIRPENQPGIQEIWTMDYQGNWQLKAEVNGDVFEINQIGVRTFYGGHFDTMQSFQNGLPDTLVSTNNLIIHELSSNLWSGVSVAISDTVYCVASAGGATYIGGSCAVHEMNSVYLSRWQNNTTQTVLTGAYFSPQVLPSIHALYYDFNQELFIGGNFELLALVGTFGNNFARMNLVQFNVEPLAAGLNGKVNGIGYHAGKIYAGGEFTTDFTSAEINHIAYLDNVAALDPTKASELLQLAPVPFTDQLKVEGIDEGHYIFYDMQGSQVKEGNFSEGRINDLQALPAGSYVLNLQHEGVSHARQVMK